MIPAAEGTTVLQGPVPVATPVAVSDAAIAPLWQSHDVAVFLYEMEETPEIDMRCLTAGECARFAAFRTPYFRARFAGSRRLAAYVAARISPHKPPPRIRISRDESGQLRIAGMPGIFICLSYSNATIAVCFSRTRCGLDIEEIRPGTSATLARIAARYVPGQKPDDAKGVTGYQVWTTIEAYCKLTNTPILDAIAQNLDFDGFSRESFVVEGRHMVSVVYPGRRKRVGISRLTCPVQVDSD